MKPLTNYHEKRFNRDAFKLCHSLGLPLNRWSNIALCKTLVVTMKLGQFN